MARPNATAYLPPNDPKVVVQPVGKVLATLPEAPRSPVHELHERLAAELQFEAEVERAPETLRMAGMVYGTILLWAIVGGIAYLIYVL
jgi:hypothetical protein